jgi:ABC-2 type transport system permease protein
VLPPAWRAVSLLNPVVYLVSGFRWSFFGTADVGVGVSVAATLCFLGGCMVLVWWIFKTGYRIRN